MIEPEGLLEENKGGGRGSRAVLLKCKQKRTIPYSFLFFINQFYQYSTSQKAELDCPYFFFKFIEPGNESRNDVMCLFSNFEKWFGHTG